MSCEEKSILVKAEYAAGCPRRGHRPEHRFDIEAIGPRPHLLRTDESDRVVSHELFRKTERDFVVSSDNDAHEAIPKGPE